MKVYVVTIHYSYESGHFDSVWSTKALAERREKEIESRSCFKPDWVEVSQATVDARAPKIKG